jgi:hypothetical protein
MFDGGKTLSPSSTDDPRQPCAADKMAAQSAEDEEVIADLTELQVPFSRCARIPALWGLVGVSNAALHLAPPQLGRREPASGVSGKEKRMDSGGLSHKSGQRSHGPCNPPSRVLKGRSSSSGRVACLERCDSVPPFLCPLLLEQFCLQSAPPLALRCVDEYGCLAPWASRVAGGSKLPREQMRATRTVEPKIYFWGRKSTMVEADAREWTSHAEACEIGISGIIFVCSGFLSLQAHSLLTRHFCVPLPLHIVLVGFSHPLCTRHNHVAPSCLHVCLNARAPCSNDRTWRTRLKRQRRGEKRKSDRWRKSSTSSFARSMMVSTFPLIHASGEASCALVLCWQRLPAQTSHCSPR